MESKVVGAGMMFLGSGCGPVLNAEQRRYLSEVKPEEFYPLARLLEMFEVARESDNDLIYATGRRWGAALKGEMVKRGATEIKPALRLLCDVYQEHHQGDVGILTIEDDGESAVMLTNGGPYPTALIVGAYQALTAALGDGEAQFATTDDERRVRISWGGG